MLHVAKVPGFDGDRPGRSGAKDESVAKWCAATGYILITCDDDFSGRWVRTGLLKREGVETIVFTWQVRGLQEQHREITARYDAWANKLAALPEGHRVWLQRRRGPLQLQRER